MKVWLLFVLTANKAHKKHRQEWLLILYTYGTYTAAFGLKLQYSSNSTRY